MIAELKRKSYEIRKGPKQLCRDLICKHAKDKSITPKKIITLPGENLLCVKTFKKQFPKASILGIERDERAFKIICSKGVNCVNSDISTYVNSNTLPTAHADIVFLDYYSPLSQSVASDIKTLLNNDNLIHRGKDLILGVTLSKVPRGVKKYATDFVESYLWNDGTPDLKLDLKTVGEAIGGFISIEANGIKGGEILEMQEYRAERNSAPMYFYCFLIRK